MGRGTLAIAGGPTIETWTVHCSHCGTAVSVVGADATARCSRCGRSIEAAATPTVPGVEVPAPTDASDSLVGTRLGLWRLERLLGRGGMGRVYEARDAAGRRVALKVLADALAGDPGFVRRFQREAKVLAALSHPHVVEVLDQGESEGRLWFAMEYVRGENLRRRIERGPVPPPEAARIAGEIASALEYAHGRGVIHRDLKPENVLLGEDGRARLADFGLLRLAREGTPEATTRLTRTDVILGTYEYMAPEQRRGTGDVDARADVFALGVILYECLTGRLPLGRFAPVGDLVRGLPRAVDTVLNRALAPEPRERFDSARAFADALRGALAGAPAAPAVARPPVAVAGPPPAPPRPPAPDAALDEDLHARTVNHLEILAVLDKVAAIVLIVSGGVLSFVVVGIPILVGGLLLLGVARRVREWRPGAREAQMAASVLLLALFPLGTALGIYGLIVVCPRHVRGAIERERRRRLGWLESEATRPHPGFGGRHAHARHVPTPPPPLPRVEPPVPREVVLDVVRRDGPGVLLRLLSFAAVLWTLYLGIFWAGPWNDVYAGPRGPWAQGPEQDLRTHDVLTLKDGGSPPVALGIAWTACGLVLAGVLAFLRWPERRVRRGFGLALVTFVLLGADLAFLGFAALRAPYPSLWG